MWSSDSISRSFIEWLPFLMKFSLWCAKHSFNQLNPRFNSRDGIASCFSLLIVIHRWLISAPIKIYFHWLNQITARVRVNYFALFASRRLFQFFIQIFYTLLRLLLSWFTFHVIWFVMATNKVIIMKIKTKTDKNKLHGSPSRNVNKIYSKLLSQSLFNVLIQSWQIIKIDCLRWSQ